MAPSQSLCSMASHLPNSIHLLQNPCGLLIQHWASSILESSTQVIFLTTLATDQYGYNHGLVFQSVTLEMY